MGSSRRCYRDTQEYSNRRSHGFADRHARRINPWQPAAHHPLNRTGANKNPCATASHTHTAATPGDIDAEQLTTCRQLL